MANTVHHFYLPFIIFFKKIGYNIWIVCLKPVDLLYKQTQKLKIMKTINELKSNLTNLEFDMLVSISKCYNFYNNRCYNEKLTSKEKGIVGSLVKKGLIYDSFEFGFPDEKQGNFYPDPIVLEAFGIEEYGDAKGWSIEKVLINN